MPNTGKVVNTSIPIQYVLAVVKFTADGIHESVLYHLPSQYTQLTLNPCRPPSMEEQSARRKLQTSHGFFNAAFHDLQCCIA